MKLTVQDLKKALKSHGSAALYDGGHSFTDGACCALECVAVAQAMKRGSKPDEEAFTAEPAVLGMPDVRDLNDGQWLSDESRTKHMLPMLAALSGWADWTPSRRELFLKYAAIQTVQQIVSTLPYLPPILRRRCRQVGNLVEARGATKAVARWYKDAVDVNQSSDLLASYSGYKAIIDNHLLGFSCIFFPTLWDVSTALDSLILFTTVADYGKSERCLVACCKILINAAKASDKK
jgi:hypothetical protein